MRRFKKCILEILKHVECHAGPPPMAAPELQGYDQLQVHYHIGLCYQAGFLQVKEIVNPSASWPMYKILGLTWQGHEALDKLLAGADFRDLNNPCF